jgi:hypothetical protein
VDPGLAALTAGVAEQKYREEEDRPSPQAQHEALEAGKGATMADSQKLTDLRATVGQHLINSGLKYVQTPEGTFMLQFVGNPLRCLIGCDEVAGVTRVKVIAPLAKEVRVDGDLGLFIATENNKGFFGKLSLDRDARVVFYEDGLLGDFLDRAELHQAVSVVVSEGDKYDDIIIQRWGGKKFFD